MSKYSKLTILICLFAIFLIKSITTYELWGDCYHYEENGLCLTIGSVKIHCKKQIDENRGKCMPIL